MHLLKCRSLLESRRRDHRSAPTDPREKDLVFSLLVDLFLQPQKIPVPVRALVLLINLERNYLNLVLLFQDLNLNSYTGSLFDLSRLPGDGVGIQFDLPKKKKKNPRDRQFTQRC